MKAIVQIKFSRILGISVTKEMLDSNPRLLNATDKTTKELCKIIEKYFNDNKIQTSVSYILKDD